MNKTDLQAPFQPRFRTRPLTSDVREMAAFVAAGAGVVRIRREKIAPYVAALLAKYPVITALDAQHHFLSEASPAATANFVLALDSVNFGSGYFRTARENGVELEYAAVAGNLKKAFGESRLNTPLKWLAATAEECHDVFAIPRGKSAELDTLMGLFADHLGMTGQMLLEHFDGDVMNLLAAAEGSAARLAGIVGGWPHFRDVAFYKGADVPFFKRAQILAADMQLAFGGKAPADFSDMGELTCFADNMVPHVLRCAGILDYAPGLAARIEAGEMIAPGSIEETEIRACSIHAVELMKEAAVAQGANVTSVNLDHIIWNKGYEQDIYAKPSHRTMTVWY